MIKKVHIFKNPEGGWTVKDCTFQSQKSAIKYCRNNGYNEIIIHSKAEI
ncbi:hypothetical protein SDC9_07437 [bioreactor metagenome]|uniref:DUF2188 domain-containing protein n=1 Tax=bioreactor metagenome TaxID=1076179 RepID=A0A644T4J0_9ZZZZ|nr:hypothetical protein [Methanobrevibacter sp.]MEA4956893.1 hypothetical protein [Methanobrevibacter sp.]